MTDQAINPASDHLDIADVERRIKAIFIGSVGNLVEWYDFYAYTAFALYFAPAFFPNSDPVVQQLNVAVLFAATFLMRPLGGWLFGFIADRYGRRLSLTLSVVCMCFGSLIIAVTPTYASIGFAALAIFAAVMRRTLQETEAFVEAKKVIKPTGSIAGLLKYPNELLLLVGLTAGGTAAFYTVTTYMQTFVRLSVG